MQAISADECGGGRTAPPCVEGFCGGAVRSLARETRQARRSVLDLGLGTIVAAGELGMPAAALVLPGDAGRLARHLLLARGISAAQRLAARLEAELQTGES